jgi:hypothetical protein
MKFFEICSIQIHKEAVDRDQEANVKEPLRKDETYVLLHKGTTSRP